MAHYELVFSHTHFTMLTSIKMPIQEDEREVEILALKQLADAYGQDFADIVESSFNVTIEDIE